MTDAVEAFVHWMESLDWTAVRDYSRADRAKSALEEGTDARRVYCWYYALCYSCGVPQHRHFPPDKKCPFAPTTYQAGLE